MEWVYGDMIDVCRGRDYDGIVFTANSVVNKDNELVMGGRCCASSFGILKYEYCGVIQIGIIYLSNI